jgi:adenosylcobinamide-GDP ribazoletransferase
MVTERADAATGTTLGDGLRMAVGTLTAFPVPAPRRIDARVGATAMLLAPVAGLLPGAAATAVCWAARAAGSTSLTAAVLALGTVALISRGLHLDGLADTADGLTAAYDRDRALAVMRLGNTGPAGAAALVLVLVLQAAALAAALDRVGPIAALVGVLAGRAMLPLACTRGIPSARADGLGATVAGTVPRIAALAVLLAVTGVCTVIVGWHGAAALALATAASATLLARTVRRFGGITGDVLGACVEVSTAAALVGLTLTA